MAKLFSVIFRSPENKENYKTRLDQVVNWLQKEFEQHQIKIISDSTSYCFIVGYKEGIDVESNQGILGFADSDDWKKSEIIPDGNFFIYRTLENRLELISDVTLSRSVYYYGTADYFVFSSLQIPMVLFKNEFDYDTSNTAWFLNSGIQKPFHSFDQTIKMLPAQNVLSLHLDTFEFSLSKYKIAVVEKADDYQSFFGVIKKSFVATFPKHKSAVLLSGGIDSRLLLNLIENKKDLNAITWTKELNNDATTDLGIAKKIATKYDLKHKIIHLKNKDFDTAFDLFLKYSEGRIDMISGYLDGFEAWKEIEKMKVFSIFRGDESFSLYNGDNYNLVRHRNGILGITDFDKTIDKYLIDKNNNFDFIQERTSESINEYAKRLRNEFRVPSILGTLNEIKCFFIEVYNPLLNNSIVEYSKQLNPDIDYREKYFKKFNSGFSTMKYATKVSIERVDDYLINHKKNMISKLKKIDQETFSAIGIEHDEIQKLLVRLDSPSKPKSKMSILKSFIPKSFKRRFLKLKKHQLSDIRLTFRILILTESYLKIKKSIHEIAINVKFAQANTNK